MSRHLYCRYVDPSKVEDLALRQMESELIDMFKRADVDATGVLSANEFHAILQALDLGLSQYQMARLLAEADENEDGEISYAEFVPIGLRFLQAYKAKAIASRKWTQREAEAETKAAEACTVLQVGDAYWFPAPACPTCEFVVFTLGRPVNKCDTISLPSGRAARADPHVRGQVQGAGRRRHEPAAARCVPPLPQVAAAHDAPDGQHGREPHAAIARRRAHVRRELPRRDGRRA